MRFNYGNNKSLNLIQESLVEEWQDEDWSKGPEKSKTGVEQGLTKWSGEFDAKSSLDEDFFKLLRVGLTAPLKIMAKTADFATNPFLNMMSAIRTFSKEQQDKLYDIILNKGMALLNESGMEGAFYGNVRDFMTLKGKSAEEIDQLFDADDKTNFETEYKNIFKQLLTGGLSGGMLADNRLTARPSADAFKKRIMDSTYNERDRDILKDKPLYYTIVPGQAQYLIQKEIKDNNGTMTKDVIGQLKQWSISFNGVLDKGNKNSFLYALNGQKRNLKNPDVVIKTVNDKFLKLKNKLDNYPLEGNPIPVFEPLKNPLLLKISDGIQYPPYIRFVFDEIQNIIEKDVLTAFDGDKEKQQFKVLIENSWKEIFKLKDIKDLETVSASSAGKIPLDDLASKLKSLGINVNITSFDIMQADLDIDNIKIYYEIEKNIFRPIVTEYDKVLLNYNDEQDETKKELLLPKLVDFESNLKGNLSEGITRISKIDTQFSKTIKQILSDINTSLDKIQADPEVRRSISNLGFLGDYYTLLFLCRLSESDIIYDQLDTDVVESIGDAFDILEDKIDAKMKAAGINPDSVSSTSNTENNAPAITNSKSMMKEILKVLEDDQIKSILQNLKLESKLKEIFKLYEEDLHLSQADLDDLSKSIGEKQAVTDAKATENKAEETTETPENSTVPETNTTPAPATGGAGSGGNPPPPPPPTSGKEPPKSNRMNLTNEKASKEKLKKAITQVVEQFKIKLKDNSTIDDIVESIIENREDFENIFSNSCEFQKEEPKVDQNTASTDSNATVSTSTTVFENVDFQKAELYKKTLQFIGDFIAIDISNLKKGSNFKIPDNKELKNKMSLLQSRLSTITADLSELQTSTFNELKQMINELTQLVNVFGDRKTNKVEELDKIITVGTKLADKISGIMDKMEADSRAAEAKLDEKFNQNFLSDKTESTSKKNSNENETSSDIDEYHTNANSVTTKIPKKSSEDSK